MTLKCLIVDDEQLARKLIEGYVAKLPELELIGSCKNPLEAREVMRDQAVDLLFLDIRMPEMLGTEFVKTLNQKPAIVLTTAYEEYALESYELEVTDYLLKPFSFDRFLKAVNKTIALLKQKAAAESEPDVEEFISLKADHRIYKVPINEIRYIEGLKEYVGFYTKERRIVVLESLKKLEQSLPADRFMRVHKSYIVNTKMIKSLYGNQVDLGDKQIPVGQSYKEAVLAHFS